MGICAGKPTQIATFTRSNARYEEGHVLRLLSTGAHAEAARHQSGR
jgi:hypothetical protein